MITLMHLSPIFIFTLTIIMFLYPILRLHISTYKRHIVYVFIAESLIISVVMSALSFFANLPFLMWILFIVYILGMIFTSRLLSRVDYYLETTMKELVVLSKIVFGVFLLSFVWELSIIFGLGLTIVKTLWLLIPILVIIFQRIFIRNVGNMYALGVYIVLSIVKWIFFPHWGLYTIIMLYIYSFLLGYVISWLIKTTRAELIVSKNIPVAGVWLVVVILTGALVLGF